MGGGSSDGTADGAPGAMALEQAHGQLTDLVERLRICHGRCAGGDEVGDLLSQWVACTEAHFAAEEACMARVGFPGIDAHCANHRAFVERLRDVHQRHRDGAPMGLAELGMLRSWQAEHIQRADRDFATYVATQRSRGNGVGRFLRRVAGLAGAHRQRRQPG